MVSGLGEQLISGAYVFGSSAIVFATIPFLFIVVKSLLDGKKDTTASGADVLGTFFLAFFVHIVSCMSFMATVKILDIIGNSYSTNYLQDKVFKIFWSLDKATVFSVAGVGNGTVEAESAYITLYTVQTITQFLFALTPLAVLSLGAVYGFMQAKKDVYRADVLSTALWTIGASIVAVTLWFLWAKIATFAVFIPDGKDIIQYVNEFWIEALQKASTTQ